MVFSTQQIKSLTSGSWFLCGIEKEGLRTKGSGKLSDSPHVDSLGSKLTHPLITTDFGESQLELITRPWASTAKALEQLQEVHSFVLSQLPSDEYMWPASMPCKLPDDEQIKIAYFGSSFIGQAKTLYRLGLSHRYGKSMQTVSGLHFNFSLTSSFWQKLAEIKSAECDQHFLDLNYFSLMRNYRRYTFVINWLFGASPCFDQSFLDNSRQAKIEDYVNCSKNTWCAKSATSLRMSDIGYMAAQQETIRLCFDCLQDYTASIREALRVVVPEFSKIGVLDEKGKHKQLNKFLLQIENEHYSQARPKRTSSNYLRPIHALERNGIEYIEIRNLDLNPYEACGISQSRADFMVLFLLWCLLEESPLISSKECDEIEANIKKVNRFGRLESTKLSISGEPHSVNYAIGEVLDKLTEFAEKLQTAGHSQYLESVKTIKREHDNKALPAQLIENNSCDQKQGFAKHMLDLAKQHKKSIPAPSKEQLRKFADLAETSYREQTRIERENHESKQSFDQFLEAYLRL